VIADVLEGAGVAAAGDIEQVVDELVREGGRLGLGRGVLLQVGGVGAWDVVDRLEPGEQVRKVPLVGVGAPWVCDAR
jgi:hypothetical protein